MNTRDLHSSWLVCGLGWIGVAVTVADISYAGYRWYMNATAVERWLNRCVFRKNKSNKVCGDARELKEFAKAQHPGQAIEELKAAGKEKFPAPLNMVQA